MPELPEVETIRRGLAPIMQGAQVIALEQRRPDLRFPFPDRFEERMKNRHINHLTRRAKYLVAHLDHGDTLIMHLGMTGSFRVASKSPDNDSERDHLPNGKKRTHDHVVFHLNNGVRIIYNDPRRFGFMLLTPSASFEQHPFIARLGVEPLGEALSISYLKTAFRGKKASLKATLMDQRIIAGLGNIYVCEALHRAHLSPFHRTESLTRNAGSAPEQLARLRQSIRDILDEALHAGGSTLRDHRGVDGTPGYFQHIFAVYDREGEACLKPECDGTIIRMTQQGRSTFFCPSCQRHDPEATEIQSQSNGDRP